MCVCLHMLTENMLDVLIYDPAALKLANKARRQQQQQEQPQRNIKITKKKKKKKNLSKCVNNVTRTGLSSNASVRESFFGFHCARCTVVFGVQVAYEYRYA